MDYDELVQKLRDWSDTHSFSAVPRAAADAITKLRAERDALQLSVAGFDAAREMLNAQDNRIDKLLAVLGVARNCIYSLDAREIYADELARIDAALTGYKP